LSVSGGPKPHGLPIWAPQLAGGADHWYVRFWGAGGPAPEAWGTLGKGVQQKVAAAVALATPTAPNGPVWPI